MEAVGLARDFEVRSRSTGAGVRDWFKDEIRASVEPASFDPRMLAHASKRGLAGAFPAQRAAVATAGRAGARGRCAHRGCPCVDRCWRKWLETT